MHVLFVRPQFIQWRFQTLPIFFISASEEFWFGDNVYNINTKASYCMWSVSYGNVFVLPVFAQASGASTGVPPEDRSRGH